MTERFLRNPQPETGMHGAGVFAKVTCRARSLSTRTQLAAAEAVAHRKLFPLVAVLNGVDRVGSPTVLGANRWDHQSDQQVVVLNNLVYNHRLIAQSQSWRPLPN